MRFTRPLWIVVSFFVLSASLNVPDGSADAGAEENTAKPAPPFQTDESALLKELREGFDWRLRVLGFGIVQQPRNSDLNPDNVLQINRYQAELDIRPDLGLKFRKVELSVKPRFDFDWKRWEDGVRSGESDYDYDIYVNEWLARYMLTEELFASYGRENLQWGPSYLISPSNPFNKDNGRNNPMIEVPGLDYARMVWIPSPKFSASFIANTDEGQMDFLRGFEKTYAFKFDYTGHKKYFSVIPSYRESDEFRIGFFGGWAASDALLLHIEGSASDSEDGSVLVGGSYTLRLGPTLTLEYYYNGAGCTDSIRNCFPPFNDSSFDDVLIRKNYILVQAFDTRIRNVFNVILRWIGDLDDGSSRSVGIVEYELNNHAKLFAVGDYFSGGPDTEFGSLLEYSLFVGAEYNF